MTVEQRLECLERRVKRYRNALVILVMSVCSVTLIGATTDDGIIRGKGLLLTNDEGMPVLDAGTDDDGNGVLRVHSKTGKKLISAGATVRGDGRLTVSSKTGQDLIYAGASRDGTGFFFEGYNKTGAWSSCPSMTMATVWSVPITAKAGAGRWNQDRDAELLTKRKKRSNRI